MLLNIFEFKKKKNMLIYIRKMEYVKVLENYVE